MSVRRLQIRVRRRNQSSKTYQLMPNEINERKPTKPPTLLVPMLRPCLEIVRRGHQPLASSSSEETFETRVIPSEATRPEQPRTANPASSTPVLKGAVPIKRCVLFVGGIDVDCDEAALIKYCRSKNVRVSSCRFLNKTNCHCKPMHSLRFWQGAWPPRTGSQKASSLVSHLMASFMMAFPTACLLALCLRSSYMLVEKKLWSTDLQPPVFHSQAPQELLPL